MNTSQDELRTALALLSNFIASQPSSSQPQPTEEDKIISNLFSKLDKQPVHEEFSLQDIDESMVDLSAPQTDNTSIEDLTKLVQQLDGSSVEVSDHENIAPLKRLEKSAISEDMAPSINVSSEFTSFVDVMQDVQRIMVLKNAVGTLNIRHYAYRSYITWYNESVRIDSRLKMYQPEPFPVKKATMLVYIYSMRVIHRYAYSTVKSVFINAFNSYIIDKKLGGNPKQEFGDDMKNLLRSLLRKYGNQVYKVNPLYNTERDKIRDSLDLSKELDARTNAVMYFGRAGGNRGDTYEAMKLSHLEFKKVHTGENDFVITVYCKVVKDKVLLSFPRYQTIMGSESHRECPVINLLIYLANHRNVFVAGSVVDVINSGDFSLKTGCGEWPLFSELRSDTAVAKPKHLSFYLIKASEQAIGKRFSMRSLRSGCVCQAIINSIIRNNRVTTSDYVAIQKHVGWTKGDSAMKEYERMALYRYSNLTDLQDINAHKDPSVVVLSHMISDGVRIDQPRLKTSLDVPRVNSVRKMKIPKALRQLEYSCNPLLEHFRRLEQNESVLKSTDFKNHHWDNHWSRRCVERASRPDCLQILCNDPNYTSLKSELAKKPSDAIRAKLRSLINVFGNNLLIDEFEKGRLTSVNYHTTTSVGLEYQNHPCMIKKDLKRKSLFRDGSESKRNKFIHGDEVSE